MKNTLLSAALFIAATSFAKESVDSEQKKLKDVSLLRKELSIKPTVIKFVSNNSKEKECAAKAIAQTAVLAGMGISANTGALYNYCMAN